MYGGVVRDGPFLKGRVVWAVYQRKFFCQRHVVEKYFPIRSMLLLCDSPYTIDIFFPFHCIGFLIFAQPPPPPPPYTHTTPPPLRNIRPIPFMGVNKIGGCQAGLCPRRRLLN